MHEHGQPAGDQAARAFELAVGALGRKERTLAEMRALLERSDLSAEAAEEAIERLVAMGELDDERFAERFAEDKRELRGWGPERIREALVARGVDHATAELAAGRADHGEQAVRAAALLAGRDIGDDRARSRALGFLTRRGYEYEIAYEAVRLAQRDAA